MSDFIVQKVKRLLLSKAKKKQLEGVRLFQDHNLSVTPSFSFKEGAFPVWRPFLRADAICGKCLRRIAAQADPALWGGKTFHFSCWHIECWDGQYDVNTRDQREYLQWVKTLPKPERERARWHRIAEAS